MRKRPDNRVEEPESDGGSPPPATGCLWAWPGTRWVPPRSPSACPAAARRPSAGCSPPPSLSARAKASMHQSFKSLAACMEAGRLPDSRTNGFMQHGCRVGAGPADDSVSLEGGCCIGHIRLHPPPLRPFSPGCSRGPFRTATC